MQVDGEDEVEVVEVFTTPQEEAGKGKEATSVTPTVGTPGRVPGLNQVRRRTPRR